MSAPQARVWGLWVMAAAAVVGVVDGILMTWDHLQFVLQTGQGVCTGGAESACGITHSADVTINRIPLPGDAPAVPLSALAVGCYGVVAWLVLKVWRKKRGAKRALNHLLFIGVASALLSVALAVYSLSYQGSICPYCAVLYAASGLLLVGALAYSRKSLKERAAGFKDALLSPDTFVHVGLFLLIVSLTYVTYARGIKPPPPKLAASVQTIATEGRPLLGDPAAPVHFVEFIDYGCPHCSDLSATLHSLLESRAGKVKVSVLNFPLAKCHEQRGGCFIPRAAECAFKQGAFGAFSKRAFELGALDLAAQKETLPSVLDSLQINEEDFAQCMEDKETTARILGEWEHGRSLGVTGTPVLFVNGRRVSGAKPLEELENMVDELLEKEGR